MPTSPSIIRLTLLGEGNSSVLVNGATLGISITLWRRLCAQPVVGQHKTGSTVFCVLFVSAWWIFFLFLVSVLFSWLFFERKKELEVGWAEVGRIWEDVEERKEYEQNILY